MLGPRLDLDGDWVWFHTSIYLMVFPSTSYKDKLKMASEDEDTVARKRKADELSADGESEERQCAEIQSKRSHAGGEAGEGVKETVDTVDAEDGKDRDVDVAENGIGDQDTATCIGEEPAAEISVVAETVTVPFKSKNPYDALRWIVINNDGKAESLIKLVALKSLFAKQLPKMPRTYIARLVFDRRHTSLAILSDDPALKDTDEEVIGSICYRAFPEMRFAEIAFCAVNASHQVKVSALAAPDRSTADDSKCLNQRDNFCFV